jgi:hypothetical protein
VELKCLRLLGELWSASERPSALESLNSACPLGCPAFPFIDQEKNLWYMREEEKRGKEEREK